MTINLQTGGYVPPQPLPGARGADIQVGQKQGQDDTVIQAPRGDTRVLPQRAKTAEDARYEQVVRAAQNFVGNLYPVGDKTFVIYKDATGQYITQYRSLRDGRVTTIPEPRLLRTFEASQSRGGDGVTLNIQA